MNSANAGLDWEWNKLRQIIIITVMRWIEAPLSWLPFDSGMERESKITANQT